MKPWEKTYQKPTSGPWEKFAAPAPTPAPSSGPTTRRPGRADPTRRAQLERELASNQAASDAAGARLASLERIEEPVRQASRVAVAPGRGVVGMAALPEIPLSMMGIRGPATAAYEALSPEALAPRNFGEQAMDFTLEGLGGGAGVLNVGRRLALSPNPIRQAVGRTLGANPGVELAGGAAGGAGAAAGGALAQELGVPEPVGQIVGGLAGGVAGARAGGPVEGLDPPARAPGAFHQVNQSDPLALARELGLVIPPSTAMSKGGPTVGVFRESLSGPSRVQARFVLENARRLNDRAARMLGLPGGSRLSEGNYEQARQPHYAVYDELRDTVRVLEEDPQLVAQAGQIGEEILGNPLLRNFEEAGTVARLRDIMVDVTQQNLPTPQVIEAIRWLRSKAVSLQNRVNDPKADEVADGYIGFATALEDALERSATRYGDPTLVDRFRQARTEIAKSYDLESITRGESLDLSKLERIGEKRPLSGELAALRDVAIHFGPETKWAPGVRVPNPETITLFGQGKRLFQRSTVPRMSQSLMSDDFQNQYGATSGQIGPDSPLGEAYFPQQSGFPEPPPAGPQGPGAGPVDFSPTGGVPPGVAGTLAGDLTASDIPPPGAGALPAAANRPGDLTASPPPPIAGDVPFQAPEQDILTALGLAPEPEGLPFTRSSIAGRTALDEPLPPPVPGSGMAEDLVPPLSDQEVLELQLGVPGAEMDIANLGRRRPPPPDEPPAAAAAPQPEGPLPQGGAPALLADEMELVEDPFRPALLADSPEVTRQRVLEMDPLAEGDAAGDLVSQIMARPGERERTEAITRGLADELRLVDEPDAPPPALRDVEQPVAERKPVKVRNVGRMDVYEDFPANALNVGGKDIATPPGAIVITEGDPATAIAAIVMEPRGDRLQIRNTQVAPDARGQRKGQQSLVYAVREAGRRNMKLDSDESLSVGAIRVYRALFGRGQLEADVTPDWDAVERAAEAGGGYAKNPKGEPWVKGIKLGPRSFAKAARDGEN